MIGLWVLIGTLAGASVAGVVWRRTHGRVRTRSEVRLLPAKIRDAVDPRHIACHRFFEFRQAIVRVTTVFRHGGLFTQGIDNPWIRHAIRFAHAHID